MTTLLMNRKKLFFYLVAFLSVFASDRVLFAQEDMLNAVWEGDTATVKMLLAKGADVNAETKEKETALLIASVKGHTEIVKMLIAKGANVNTSLEKDGITPLMLASRRGHTEIVKMLLAKGVDFNMSYATAVLMASDEGHTNIVQLLVQAKRQGADKKASIGVTDLVLAAAAGKVDLVRTLLDEGADVNERDKYGFTPLMQAVFYNSNAETVRLLLKKGADVNAKDQNQDATALIIAAGKSDINIVKILLDGGADVFAKTKAGWTAADVAFRDGRADILELIKNKMGESVKPLDPTLHERLLVISIQTRLKDAGFDPGLPDGIVGPKTKEALRQYQASQGIAVTGEIDAATKISLIGH